MRSVNYVQACNHEVLTDYYPRAVFRRISCRVPRSQTHDRRQSACSDLLCGQVAWCPATVGLSIGYYTAQQCDGEQMPRETGRSIHVSTTISGSALPANGVPSSDPTPMHLSILLRANDS